MTVAPEATYNTKLPCRAMIPLPKPGEGDAPRWMVASSSLDESANEIHTVEYRPDTGDLSSVSVFAHKYEVLDLAVSEGAPGQVLTLFNATSSNSAHRKITLWQMKERSFLMTLDERATIKGETSAARKLLWSQDSKSLVVLEERGLCMWDVPSLTQNSGNFAKKEPLWSKNLYNMSMGTSHKLSPLTPAMEAACWDPADHFRLYACWGTELQGWDLRSASVSVSIPQAHKVVTRSLDVSKTRPHLVATGGDDCGIKVWDIRKPTDPVVHIAAAHSHWVWQVKFHPKYDRLLLSASSDSNVALWNLGGIREGATEADAVANQLVALYDGAHGDSVYSASWGVTNNKDTFAFASLSYDGRIAVNVAPSEAKYHSML